mmetsp:Transcript_39890/g.35588  ORF Transcript_39890/g.35588 Transcript_39890/m.35588 type:complete len:136 (-) Transcript_39890:369-776(-)
MIVVDHQDLYYDPNNQALVYHDANLTQLAFTVVNYTTYPIEDGLTQTAVIIAVNDTETGEVTVFGMTSHFIFDTQSFDIRPWLKDNGIDAELFNNYFFLDEICGPPLYSDAYAFFKKQGKILGDWNVLAIFDPRK